MPQAHDLILMMMVMVMHGADHNDESLSDSQIMLVLMRKLLIMIMEIMMI